MGRPRLAVVLAHALGVLSSEALVRTCALASRPVRSSRVAAAATGTDWDMTLFSPAKINLFLRVIKRRDDGFHELASLFQAIDLGDTLSIKVLGSAATRDEFECNVEGVPTDSSNLVLRALEVYRAKAPGKIPYFGTYLEKKTPIQAGLGGGSSNAATALYAANALCGNCASAADLELWSADLGSDVTFFLGPTGTAYCTGRGEIVEGVPPLDDSAAVYVVKPSMGLSTPLVFKTLAKSNYETLRQDRKPNDLLQAFALGAAPEDYVNDLEPPAFECAPALAQLKDMLADAGFDASMMSGSGTSLFAVAKPETDAEINKRGDFAANFALQVKSELDLDVTVYKTKFLRKNQQGWYDDHP